MKSKILKTIFLLFVVNISFSQAWMTSLDIAQKLALVQNKMVLMVWEESTKYPYPVLVNDTKGRTFKINNLFEDENISPLIWEHFVPVIVSENEYEDLYNAVKGKRKQTYIDKLNDEGIKIMDINGNIINVSMSPFEYVNISKLIGKYAFNTRFISAELKNYSDDSNFYSAYYLASKYLDFSLYASKDIRKELINLANIYLDEAQSIIVSSASEDKLVLEERCELLRIQEILFLKRPKKVLRKLKKMDAENIENNNQSMVSFLYYTAFKILDDEKNAVLWLSKVSSVNLKKAQLIINLNS